MSTPYLNKVKQQQQQNEYINTELDLTSLFNKRKRVNNEIEENNKPSSNPKPEKEKESNIIDYEDSIIIDDLFIPKRKIKRVKKERRRTTIFKDEDDKQIVPIEELKGELKPNRIKETFYEIFETSEDERRYKINMYYMCEFGCNLYLNPKNVLEITNYLVTQYSNFSLDESLWFNDLIKGILNNAIDIRITADHGLSNSHDQRLTYLLLIKFFGSDRAQIPKVYFITKDNKDIIFFLYYIQNPYNKCFLNSNTAGLRGEIEQSFFKYNQILDYFFEPSFIIISLFDQYLNYLSETTLSQSDMDYIHYFNNAKKSIEIIDNIVEYNKLKCLNSFNSNYRLKLQILRNDLIELYNILNSSISFKYIRDQIRKLWSKKASFCVEQQTIRKYEILKNLK